MKDLKRSRKEIDVMQCLWGEKNGIFAATDSRCVVGSHAFIVEMKNDLTGTTKKRNNNDLSTLLILSFLLSQLYDPSRHLEQKSCAHLLHDGTLFLILLCKYLQYSYARIDRKTIKITSIIRTTFKLLRRRMCLKTFCKIIPVRL